MNERQVWDEAILQQALAWHLRLRDGDGDDWEDFTVWLEREPAHSAAYDEIARRDAASS